MAAESQVEIRGYIKDKRKVRLPEQNELFVFASDKKRTFVLMLTEQE